MMLLGVPTSYSGRRANSCAPSLPLSRVQPPKRNSPMTPKKQRETMIEWSAKHADYVDPLTDLKWTLGQFKNSRFRWGDRRKPKCATPEYWTGGRNPDHSREKNSALRAICLQPGSMDEQPSHANDFAEQTSVSRPSETLQKVHGGAEILRPAITYSPHASLPKIEEVC
jgi:hypothetical protein